MIQQRCQVEAECFSLTMKPGSKAEGSVLGPIGIREKFNFEGLDPDKFANVNKQYHMQLSAMN